MSSNLFRKAIKEALEQSTDYPKGKTSNIKNSRNYVKAYRGQGR